MPSRLRNPLRVLYFSVCALASGASFNPDTPVATVQLRDGRVLRNVVFVSFSEKVTMARWDGGRGTLNYSDLPSELAEQMTPLRPKPTAAPAPTPAPARRGPVAVEKTSDKFQKILDGLPPREKGTLWMDTNWKRGPKQELRGQCFIVTKGGQNIKLGGVSVAVYPATAFKALKAELDLRAKPRAEYLRKAFDAAKAEKNHLLAGTIINLMIADKNNLYSLLPKPLFSSETDADGAFVINHDLAEGYVIFAEASRQAGGDPERYVWVVESEKIQNPQRFFLNNANLSDD